MKKLTLYVRCSLAAVIVFAAALAGALILRPPYLLAYAPIILASGLSALLRYTSARRNLRAARLIVENTIVSIQPAVICGQANFEIYVSVFGILLDDRIIEWGGGSGKSLKAVEIGCDYISIDCGTKGNNQHVRLLYSRPGDDELATVIEKFRYETGVVPVKEG